MKISLICNNSDHPIHPYLKKWILNKEGVHQLVLVNSTKDLQGGDILFVISCSEIISKEIRNLYQFSLVLHAGDLPKNKGWSPHIWEIIEGAEYIVLSLIEAADKLDSGKIYCKKKLHIPKNSLWDEINDILFNAELDLMSYFIDNHKLIVPECQNIFEPSTYRRRRSPDDSVIDPCKTIQDQFDLIRVSDPKRYPAHFKLNGTLYKLTIEKISPIKNK